MNILSNRLYKALEYPATKVSKPVTAFHPSSASIKILEQGEEKVVGTCLRQQYYRAREPRISNKGNIDYSISAHIGDSLHELMGQYIDNYGFMMGMQRIEAEHAFYLSEENISGRCDLLVWDYEKNEPAGIEVKSVGEYKANVCMERPAPEHVMQSMIYLYTYDKEIPDGMLKPKKWYIWYISRTESWSLKSKKHQSPFQMLWDFYITLGTDGVPTIYTPTGVERWENYNIEAVLERYRLLDTYLKNDELPPRDYDISYSEEKIMTEYKLGKITRKLDKERIEKWVAKGCKPGMLKLDMGDAECNFCAWKDHCWSLSSNLEHIQKFNFPRDNTVQSVTQKEDEIL